ncbi:MAG: hypothetical protein R6X12_08010 [bacterium]
MKAIIVLKTNQSDEFWYEPREVGYPRLLSYDFLDDAAKNLPIPGIGLYLDRHRGGRLEPRGHLEPALLRITGIRKDDAGKPHIRVEPLARLRGVRSADLDRLLGVDRWIAPVARDAWSQVQRELGIKPPREWSHMLEVAEAGPECREWLGPRFARLLEAGVDYAAVRDVVAETLTALGLDVTRLTHTETNENNPDGFACTPPGERFGYWLVYDCRSLPFHLAPEGVFRVRSYIARYGRELPALKAVPAAAARFLFIAPGYEDEPDTERNVVEVERVSGARGCLLTFEALLALLALRIRLGYRFTLADFDRVFTLNNLVDAVAVRTLFADR